MSTFTIPELELLISAVEVVQPDNDDGRELRATVEYRLRSMYDEQVRKAARPLPTTVSEIERRHSGHFFDADTLKFFASIVYEPVVRGAATAYFITSERGPDKKRRFTIRATDTTCTSIETVGEFQAYRTFDTAMKALQRIVNGG